MIRIALLTVLALAGCAASPAPPTSPAEMPLTSQGWCSPPCDRCHTCSAIVGGGLHPGICIPTNPKPAGCP